MLIWENTKLALNGLIANKMRSFLTMIGIVIGIASVIAIMTLGNSIGMSVRQSMDSLGANQIVAGIQKKNTGQKISSEGLTYLDGPRVEKPSETDLITQEMLDEIKERFAREIMGISLTEQVGEGKIQTAEKRAYVEITGYNYDGLENERLTLLAGRTLTERDQEEGRNVVLASEKMVRKIFGDHLADAVGNTVEVLMDKQYVKYTIVGVYQYEESAMDFTVSSEDDMRSVLYLPLKAAREQKHNTSGYTRFTALAAPGVNVEEVSKELQRHMNEQYYRNNESFQISAMNMEAMVKSVTRMVSGISLVIAAIGGISLLVGGIGVMNIMLVSITERTREIGTRKALGADNNSIRIQFIMESVVLCMIGGVLGVLLGIGVAFAATRAMGYQISPSLYGIAASVGFSALIGIFFGYYPANRAAKMDPIDALRYE